MTEFTRYINGVDRDVTFTNPSGFDLIRLVTTAPESLTDPDKKGLKPKDLDSMWVKRLIVYCSDMTFEEIDLLTMQGLNKAITHASRAFANEDAPKTGADYRLEKNDPFESLDLNEDGSVDVDEWR